MKLLEKSATGASYPRIGIGCGQMLYEDSDIRKSSIETVHAAMDAGVSFFDTGTFYQFGESEQVLREALKGYPRDSYYLAVKFGHPANKTIGKEGDEPPSIDVSPKAVRDSLALTLKRLNVDYIDLFEPCGLDPVYPMEETLGAMADLVKVGYVRHIGMSMINSDELRRAYCVHPISAVEYEYSIMSRDIEKSVLGTTKDLGVSIVSFANLARGLLGGTWSLEKLKEMAQGRFRKKFPDGDVSKVYNCVERLTEFAAYKGLTAAQLAVAWVLNRSDNIMCLSGSIHAGRMLDMLKCADVEFTTEDLEEIDSLIPEELRMGLFLRSDVQL
ncbi:MAG: aldo/keto reductase [Lachnospiraceae bacterium]|jgi:aryl-alcohol dehydrogenase-like predicted oxidoreductase|nr:aldo/keto reductase [Lachnospiraceae bacterium]